MRHSRLLPGLLAGLCLAFPASVFAQPGAAGTAQDHPAPKPGEQSPQSFEAKVGLKYLLYLPKDYGKEQDKKWPFILFLHGAGERGDDVQRVAIHGPPKLVKQGKEFPFVIVSPQCPQGEWWQPVVLKKLVDDVRSKYSIDPDRMYLTGLSMGGYGTWDMAEAYPQLFAAIAPICGGGNTVRARSLARIPIWVFHGEEDPTVPIKNSEEMVEAVKKAGNNDVQFTRYPGLKHDSWTVTYDNPKLYEWFLSHKRSAEADGGRGGRGGRAGRGGGGR